MRQEIMRVFFVAGFLALLGFSTPVQAGIVVGDPAPELTVKEINDTPFDLSKTQGKVTIVHFWATWCGPCRVELPELASFYHHYHSQGVEVIGMSMDGPHDLAAVKTSIAAFEIPAAMVSDTQNNGFGTPYSLPTTYVIDRTGIVKAILTPDKTPLTERALADIVKPLLAH